MAEESVNWEQVAAAARSFAALRMTDGWTLPKKEMCTSLRVDGHQITNRSHWNVTKAQPIVHLFLTAPGLV